MKKKIIIMFISLLLMTALIPTNASADQTSDTFDITVTGEYLWQDRRERKKKEKTYKNAAKGVDKTIPVK